MASAFAWLDFSEAERDKMTKVIELFRESDTRDELGIGAIRDTFADLLFPGTSTIQTRARYFLFIPWTFLEMERRKVPSRKASGWGRSWEVRLINALEAGGESSGVIGIVAKQSLKRLPSSVYWHGLGVLGIRRFHGSVEGYFRSLDTFYRISRETLVSEDGEVLDRAPRNWHAGLPQRPENLFEQTTFDLTREEAEYLRDRIVFEVPDSMLAHLVDEELPAAVDFPWQHPALSEFPPHLREWLVHARNLSETLHGAPLLYNLMLAEKARRDDLKNHYTYRLEEWASILEGRGADLASWSRERMWEIVRNANPRFRTSTKSFIDSWLDLALDGPQAILQSQPARALIEHRERTLKGSQARLHNTKALELWNEAAGTAPLNYRWPTARQIVDDVATGLRSINA